MVERAKNEEELGTPAFGYFRTSTERQRNVLRIDVETAPIVRMIYRWASMGVGMSDIAGRLNLMGVPSPDGCRWTDHNLPRLLSNPIYYGDFISGRWVTNMHRKTETDRESWLIFEEHHEAIVSRELWMAAQEKLPKRKRGAPIPRKLTGIVYCSTCGHRLCVRHQSGKTIYHCPNHTGLGIQKTEAEPLAKPPAVDERDLVKVVLEECRKYMGWINDRKEAIRTADLNTGMMGQLHRRSINLMRQKKAAETALMRLYEDYHDGIVDADSFISLCEQKTIEKEEAEKAITDVLSAQRQTKIRVKKVRSFIADICALDFKCWNEETVKALVDRVELQPDGKLTIIFRMKGEIEKLTGEEKENL